MQSDGTSKRESPVPVYLAGPALVFVVGFCDWWTGPDISIALFYLIPTAFVAWRAGRVPGIFTGVACTLLWLAVELSWGRKYSSPLVPCFNAALQFAVTIFSAVTTAAVGERERQLQTEISVRKAAEVKLGLVNETLENRVAERSAAAEKRATDLARSEMVLRHRTNILRSILTSMGEAVVVTDDSNRIRLFNPAAGRLFKIDPTNAGASEWSEPSESLLSDLLAGYGGAADAICQSMHAESIDSLELFRRASGGNTDSSLRMSARSLLSDDNAPRGVVFVFSDITALKEMDKLVAEASEREQQRIGQDLHDGLGQHLVSTAFGVNMLKDKLASKGLIEAREAGEIAELLNNAITQSRDLARGLYPVRLEEEGLSSALEELAENVTRNSEISCRVESNRPIQVYDALVGSNLYRLAQEAVTNAVKHGRPKSIVIRLEQQGTITTLTIVNDGKSYAGPETRDRGMGLRIMKYRARMIGAELQIGPGPGSGTIVRCAVPNLSQTKEADGSTH